MSQKEEAWNFDRELCLGRVFSAQPHHGLEIEATVKEFFIHVVNVVDHALFIQDMIYKLF